MASQTVAKDRAIFSKSNPARIYMVVWRGCEEACKGFINDFEDRGLPVNINVIDVMRKSRDLPDIRQQLVTERPDLVVTWGTSTSLGILGTREEFGEKSAIGDIPAVFMIVADPIRSDLIKSYDSSERNMITGVKNRIPESVQMNLILDNFPIKNIGVINDPNEINSTLNTQKLRKLSDELDFNLLELEYEVNADAPLEAYQISAAMAKMHEMGADAIYVGSSSFNLENRDIFVQSALENSMPVFSGYAKMVTESAGLMAVANSYANIGKLAASQARKVLFQGSEPRNLPILELKHFSIYINMRAVNKLDLYPPIQLLNVAKIFK